MNGSNCLSAPLRSYPGMNRFVLERLEGTGRAAEFLPRTTGELRAPGTPRGLDALVASITSSNRAWGLHNDAELERWNRGESVTLIAGQQVGIGGGPLYTLAKIASLLKMKRELEAKGIAATAFFWLATEDHDYAEVATLALETAPGCGIPADADVNHQRQLEFLRHSRGIDSRAIVGNLPVPDAFATRLVSLLGLAERPAWLRPGITLRESFARLIASVIPHSLVLVDALDPALRRAGAPLFSRIVEQWSEVQSQLANRSAALASAGYAPQVVPREGEPYTLLFAIDESGQRQALHAQDGGWRAGDSPIGDARAFVDENAEHISTSALTRPLLQDFVLRPDVFVGGPSEVAYYAQIAPLHELLNVPMPRVALRGHALVAPRRTLRACPRFGIDLTRIFSSADELLAEQEPAAVEEIRAIAQRGRQQLEAEIVRIRELALPADHAVARAVNRSIGHIEYHFEKLAQRAIRGVVRKDKERFAAVRDAVATLYPEAHVQDRIAAWIPFWYQYGTALVDALVEQIEPDAPVFHIIEL